MTRRRLRCRRRRCGSSVPSEGRAQRCDHTATRREAAKKGSARRAARCSRSVSAIAAARSASMDPARLKVVAWVCAPTLFLLLLDVGTWPDADGVRGHVPAGG